MDLCVNGCGDVYNSGELLEVLELYLGIQKPHEIKVDIEDIALHNLIENRVKRKLMQKGKHHDSHE